MPLCFLHNTLQVTYKQTRAPTAQTSYQEMKSERRAPSPAKSPRHHEQARCEQSVSWCRKLTVSRDPQEGKEPGDHGCGVERATPGGNKGKLKLAGTKKCTRWHSTPGTLLMEGDSAMVPSVVSSLPVGGWMSSLSFSSSMSSYSWPCLSLWGSCPLCLSLQRSRLSDLPARSWWCELVDFLRPRCWLKILSLFLSLSRVHCVSLCSFILSVFSPHLPPHPSSSSSFSLALPLAH